MGCIRSFKNATLLVKISLSVLGLATSFSWTSFVSTTWGDAYLTSSSSDLTGYGLWRRCDDNEKTPNCETLLGWNLQWYRSVQAFCTMGFVCVNLCFFLIILLVFVPECQLSKSVSLWIAVLAFWSGLCYTVAIIVFAVGFDGSFERSGTPGRELAYGWGTAIAVALLEIIGGILMALESKKVGAKITDL